MNDALVGILMLVYIFCGAMANSFLKHHVLKMRTVYVFSMQRFIIEKVCLGAVLGWFTIPVAILLRLCGVGKSEE